MKRTNRQRHKEGWHLALQPPSKMVGKKIFVEVRDKPGTFIEVEIT